MARGKSYIDFEKYTFEKMDAFAGNLKLLNIAESPVKKCTVNFPCSICLLIIYSHILFKPLPDA